jgi:hypothetical protein
MSEPEKKKRLSYEEILQGMEDIARDPDDKDRFKALKALAASQGASMVLPDPLSEIERIERLERLMRGSGTHICHSAYTRAFPHSHFKVSDAEQLKVVDIPPETMKILEKVRGLKTLYRHFPEIKRPGFPRGYPVGRGIESQTQWARQTAIKILLDREQAKVNAAAIEAAEAHRQIVGP